MVNEGDDAELPGFPVLCFGFWTDKTRNGGRETIVAMLRIPCETMWGW